MDQTTSEQVFHIETVSIPHKNLKTDSSHPNYGFSTKAIHSGQEIEPTHGCVNTPIYLSSTYAQKEPGTFYSQYDYSRCGNPTRKAFDDCLAALEHAKYGMSFSAGTAALSCVCLALLNAGDHVICSDVCYGGTQEYLKEISQKTGKAILDFVDLSDFEALDRAKKNETKILIFESPINPTLKICDIERICAWAKKNDIISIVDNTFASPYLQSPILLGADICLNSCTKFITGHNDVMMGSLTTNSTDLMERLYFIQKSTGAIPSPIDSYLALRSLKTLKIRMEEHCKNAQIVAEFLNKHPKVLKVCYPGLRTHPNHEIAKKQMRGFGGMVSFYLDGDLAAVKKFCTSLKIFILAESLGGVESLFQVPAFMASACVPIDEKKKHGIDDNFIRVSVGLENIEDLLKDLDQALTLI